ncbi:MAG: hypothetical protein A2790_14695 [Phenylobacterium sp. RIFCSPHIGHO2_01_FULL_69_31]|uniref:right-handed parallel beta-helix repeat-containing protein n=1 Tax=Phenylobacterium sp. RIFCSPHIGHO2_01_FULL_69_31 TaxID=1801944 RepID=UPI0008C50DB9|nr:right-handed parallel beta-helix repeat-containing protein [Phenylobacterium sp. RIFCSPHIGHO2_01_FULL_69_31]OHB27887.1 MAG: hypothetical protein A2790_14695 [Phenylobacterium sp. RIFCSPHIGHO2_01_FULL_69_31]
MVSIIVKDSAGLVSALKAAQSGDVIQLAPGTYSPFVLSGLKFDAPVTITSLDPGNPAKLTGLNVKGSEGLEFNSLEFVVGGTVDNPFQVSGSANIGFDNLNVHGSLDGNAQNDVAAFLIRDSKNVEVTNSEFQQLRHGVAHLNTDGLNVSDNYFHDIQTDGVRGGGSSHVVVSGNYFTNFDPVDGDHPDAIQFWTGNTSASATDIAVTGNVIVRGSGAAVQGIFFRDQVGNLPYEGVVVSGNLVVGGMPNGIAVSGGNNVIVDNNVVVGLPDQRSWISTGGASNVTLSNNTSTYYLTDGTSGLVQDNNATIASPTDGGRAAQVDWLSSHSMDFSRISGAAAFGDAATSSTILSASNLTTSVLDAAALDAVKQMELARLQLVKIAGTAAGDRLGADGLHDMIIDGGAGNDVLTGGGLGHNTLIGGAGDDTFYVGSVFDVAVEAAGGGTDLVVASIDFSLADNIEGLRMTGGATYGAGNELDNRITGTSGDNEIRGAGGADLLQGMDGNDGIDGGAGNDNLNGGAGQDTLLGGAGADKLLGGDDADTLAGGSGIDTLEGGTGADTMSGGADADQFFFRQGDLSMNPDFIVDFNAGEGDRIAVSMIDANVNLANDQKFIFIGTSAFHKVAGELRYEVSQGHATVMFDTNGDGAADMMLRVGATSLQGSDFML